MRIVLLTFAYVALNIFVIANMSGISYAAKSCAGEAMTLTSIVDLDFGSMEAALGSGNIDMGSDGTVTYGTGYSGSGLGIGGQFQITGKMAAVFPSPVHQPPFLAMVLAEHSAFKT